MLQIQELPPAQQSWFDVFSQIEESKLRGLLTGAADALGDELLERAGVESEREIVTHSLAQMRRQWQWIARREQLPPAHDHWVIWVLLSGRGFGKSLAGAQWLIGEHKKGIRLSGILGRTKEDVQRYCIRGVSGILSVAPPDFMPERRGESLRWPGVGQAPYPNAESLLFYSKNPDSIRGPNLERAWCDELAAWLAPKECWDNLRFTMRAGTDPKIVVTTTPKPLPVIRDLEHDGKDRPERVVITRGSLYENRANLADVFVEEMRSAYEGTRLGRQEIHGETLMQAEGALWDWDWFERRGFRLDKAPSDLERVGVAIDPAATNTENSSETGIIKGGRGADGRGYLLADYSGKYTPSGWARTAILAYFGQDETGIPANTIIAERNNGGDMVKNTIDAEARELHREGLIPTAHVPVKVVWASHGKAARAEPVSARYEAGRVSHCGHFEKLEYQLTSWEPDSGLKSPDRLDALVWLFTWALDVAKRAEWKPSDVQLLGPLAVATADLYDDEAARMREEYPI